MGIDYNTILVVGKEFNDEHEAEEFFTSKIELTEDELEEVDRDGFSEFLQCFNKESWPTGGMINHYTGRGFWIGFEVDTSNISNYLSSSQYGINTWQQLFGETPVIINEVCIW